MLLRFFVCFVCTHSFAHSAIQTNPLFVQFIHLEMRLISMVHTYQSGYTMVDVYKVSYNLNKLNIRSISCERAPDQLASILGCIWMNRQMYVAIQVPVSLCGADNYRYTMSIFVILKPSF